MFALSNGIYLSNNAFKTPLDKPSRTIANNAYKNLTKMEAIARICHETNRAYCASLGDYTMPSWENAPDWQRQSARVGVLLAIQDGMVSPEQNHERWLAHKQATGWKYGKVKDETAKTHPWMVKFSSLTQDQQMKDILFNAILTVLLD
jgi:hypothetical protein